MDNLAVCFRKIGLYNEAFRASVHSLMIDSTNVTAWANCGNIALLQNDIPKALKATQFTKNCTRQS